ncbi:MAG: methionine synthase [Desulfovibrio sp.]|nr:MAG: methionine synthase [Desulfovibrio sp.]
MASFVQALLDSRPLIFDGGMGTMLQGKGMPPGVSPERFGQDRPEVIAEIHEEYLRAGAQAATTNTFGGTRYKLDLGMDTVALNRLMAAKAREAVDNAAPGKAWVVGSVGPTGKFLKPLGELTFSELVEAFKEQIRGLVDGGVDLILAETHYDLAEVKAVVVAAREICSLPVGASMTFENGVSLTGTTPKVFALTMDNLGVDLIATNCSAGPEGMLQVAKAIHPVTRTPLLAQPNAGLPELVDGETVFRLGAEDFASQTALFVDHGVQCLGGCCGTTPAHISALRGAVEGRDVTPSPAPEVAPLTLTSRTMAVSTGAAQTYPFLLIGERINPTGKKQLAEELAKGEFTEALKLAKEQVEAGAKVLDVNVGAPMVDEKVVLPELVRSLASRFPVPLCLDTADGEAAAAALREYPGSPLVNSISGEPGRMELLGPLCKTYGAPFILLPLTGKKLPETAKDRIAIINSLLEQADGLGIPRRLVMIDGLALTVSSKPEAAMHCMETLAYCRDVLQLPTTLGLSNISFGLPARELLNSAFLAMAATRGLTTCIANPSSPRMQQTLAAVETLMARDPQAESFIAGFSGWTPSSDQGGATGGTGGPAGTSETLDPGQAVISGAKEEIVALVEAELDKGVSAANLVNEMLIPAINEVGDKYERKEYFLPQLLRSAETMQTAFGRLEPLLKEESGGEERPVVVMATVEGDIHDIGKNIVSLILGNHGFEVVDMGKDVDAETVVQMAENKGAFCIGLSALMTTTMTRMEDTVKLVRDKGLDISVMVGGAVVTEEFAQSIGADGYAEDAVAAAKLARKLLDTHTQANDNRV